MTRTIKQRINKLRRDIEEQITIKSAYEDIILIYNDIIELQKECPHNTKTGDQNEMWCDECGLRNP